MSVQPTRAAAAAGTVAAALFIALQASWSNAEGATLHVGPDKTYKTVRAAAEAADDGDLILIDAGIYRRDVVDWDEDNLTVRAVGGKAHMRADGAHKGGKGIWVVSGNDFTAENIEFSGARVPDGNGAGIRIESDGTFTLRGCHFHDNQNGILGESDRIVIENCTFDRNGAGDGRTHNIYIWGDQIAIRHSAIRRARVGHNIKTRAKTSYILYNRITDETTGTGSYSIDVPDAGRTYIIGNVIEQGPNSENSGIVSYGAESDEHVKDLYVVNNTFVNNRERGGTFLQLRSGTRAYVVNNIFAGPGTPWTGGVVEAKNNFIRASRGNDARFAAPASYDFRLTPGSPRSIVNAGVRPGKSATGYDLTPRREYVYNARGRSRPVSGALDIGAFELTGGARR